MTMRDNERNALVAALRELRDTGDVSDWRAMETALTAAIEALAAPAEGSIAAILREDCPGSTETQIQETARRIRALIDSAGGAKGVRDAYEGAREDLLDWKGRAQRAERTLRGLGYTGIDASEAPQPAEGDGAVADALMVVNDAANDARHAGDYVKANALVRARVTLYRASTRPAATAVVADGFVLVPRAAALVAAAVADEWAAMFADIPGLEKYDRFQYGPAVEQMRDDMLAAAPAAPKGGVAGFDVWFDEYSKQNYDDYMLARAAWDAALAAPKGGGVDEAIARLRVAPKNLWMADLVGQQISIDRMRAILTAALTTGEQP